jgi:hypothetical protein
MTSLLLRLQPWRVHHAQSRWADPQLGKHGRTRSTTSMRPTGSTVPERPAAHPRARESVLFRRVQQEITHVHFIGVGIRSAARQSVRFNDYLATLAAGTGSTSISSVRAYHAVAIDETRKHFAAARHQPTAVDGQAVDRCGSPRHSNVGGVVSPGLSTRPRMVGRSRARRLAIARFRPVPISSKPAGRRHL